MDPPPHYLFLLLAVVSTCLRQGHQLPTRFTINQVTLTILPAVNVTSGTNVELRCDIDVSADGSAPLTYTYSFYKGSTLMYTKNHSSSSLTHRLDQARASSSGEYRCQVHIDHKNKKSPFISLTVTGLQTPRLRLSTHNITEGEHVTAECSAPKEQGPFEFAFYRNSTLVTKNIITNNSAQYLLGFDVWGVSTLYCQYTLMFSAPITSEISNKAQVTVTELQIHPSIAILPSTLIIEGDTLEIHCEVQQTSGAPLKYETILRKGSRLLESGNTKISWRTQHAQTTDSGEYECKSEVNSVEKTASGKVRIRELFSKPTFTIQPKDVFEGEKLSFSCGVDNVSSERINKSNVKFMIYKDNTVLLANFSGKHTITASISDSGNYTCQAEAKFIQKNSTVLAWKTKALVSEPLIGVKGKVIVGKRFQITCQSKRGSLPITYTLKKAQKVISSITVRSPSDQAIFQVSIHSRVEIRQFACEAQNRNTVKVGPTLNVTVIEPVPKPVLLAKSSAGNLLEGHDLVLECSVKSGSSPFNFSWYHEKIMLGTNTTWSKTMTHTVKNVGRKQSGQYYCRASNGAEETQWSKEITITVKLAVWKYIMIAVSIFLVVIVIIAIFMRCNTRRGKRKESTELSEKAPRSQSYTTANINLTHDAKGYNKVDGEDMRRSVWSEQDSDSDSDEQSCEESGEHSAMVYAQVVPPESPNNTADAVDHTDVSSVEYAQLNHAKVEMEPEQMSSGP